MEIINLLKNADLSSLRFLFQQYGINEEPSIENILIAYNIYGDEFLQEVAFYLNNTESAEGLTDAQKAAALASYKMLNPLAYGNNPITGMTPAKKKFDWSQVKTGFDQLLAGVNQGLDQYGKARTVFGPQSQFAVKDEPKPDNTWMWAVGIAGVAVVVLVLVIVFHKKS